MKAFVLIATIFGVAFSFDAYAADLGQERPMISLYKGYAAFKMGHYEKARSIWLALAKKKSGEAAFNLGILYEDAKGVAEDMTKALSWYEKAAEWGHRGAQYRLGLIYALGERVAKDLPKARRWMAMAAKGGDRDAHAWLKRLGAKGSGIVLENSFAAAEAASAVGNYEKAFRLLSALVKQGNAKAQSRLAFMYERGQGTPTNLPEAARLFRLASQQGEAEAQYALFVMLATGAGQEKSEKEALVWLKRAAAQGFPEAEAALQRVISKPINPKNARE
jgi:uncharacterized protein